MGFFEIHVFDVLEKIQNDDEFPNGEWSKYPIPSVLDLFNLVQLASVSVGVQNTPSKTNKNIQGFDSS